LAASTPETIYARWMDKQLEEIEEEK